jgi:hypothetical protein
VAAGWRITEHERRVGAALQTTLRVARPTADARIDDGVFTHDLSPARIGTRDQVGAEDVDRGANRIRQICVGFASTDLLHPSSIAGMRGVGCHCADGGHDGVARTPGRSSIAASSAVSSTSAAPSSVARQPVSTVPTAALP